MAIGQFATVVFGGVPSPQRVENVARPVARALACRLSCPAKHQRQPALRRIMCAPDQQIVEHR